jgi:hypothetical protein
MIKSRARVYFELASRDYNQKIKISILQVEFFIFNQVTY